jgi:IS605 OrfB family transposase
LSKSVKSKFGWWVRVSTLKCRGVAHVPFDIHPYGQKILRDSLTSGGKLSSGVLLNRRNGVWSVQLCVSAKVRPRQTAGKKGIDTGMVNMLADSAGHTYGHLDTNLTRRVESDAGKMARKQKLNVCLKKKELPEVSLVNGKTERWVRNEAGQAINQFVRDLAAQPLPQEIILEKLTSATMRMKSREGNRRLKAGQISYIAKTTRRKLDCAGIPWREVNPAYTSQECPNCGFTMRQNRPTQDKFICLLCRLTENADKKAAVVIEGRSDDDDLNTAHFKLVGVILAERFMRRWGGVPPPLHKERSQATLWLVIRGYGGSYPA